MPIIVEGRTISTPGVTVNTFDQTGITLPRGFPYQYSRLNQPVSLIVLHWTAGFRSDPRALRDVFVDRNVGCQFSMDRNGVLHQYFDLEFAGIHANESRRSIGIEIQNPGLILRGRDDDRERYQGIVRGREYTFLRFTDAQIRATKQICRILCQTFNIPYRVPTNEDGTLHTEVLSAQQKRTYSGIAGHFHLTTRGKLDPGRDLLESILSDQGPAPPIATQDLGTATTPVAVPEEQTRRRPAPPPPEDPPLERIQAIAQGRTETPADDGDLNYAILGDPELEASSLDPHASAIIDSSDINSTAQQPFERFKSQMSAMKSVSTLDLAQAVPVLALFTLDENNELVNLNKEIFGISSFHNIFDSVEIPEGVEAQNPERALASLENWTVTIQQPSVGGIVGMAIGTLSIKIHNPTIVTTTHPKGRFLSYLMRQGYPVRVRYGVTHPRADLEEAFQWIEEDFFTSEHTLKVNDDQSVNVNLTLIPAAFKIFNQILIGENLRIENISQEDTLAASEGNTQTQRDLETVLTPANSPDQQLGLNDFRQQDGTVYSVLHGAVSRLDVIRNSDNFQPVRIQNLVNGLQSLQSRLLTQRYENLLSERAYRYSGRSQTGDLEYTAINLGPLFYTMVLPELERTVELIAVQGMNIGPVFSNDANSTQVEEASSNNQNAPPPRDRIKMIFGNFNDFAGQWAQKPISTFPVNIEPLFAELRRERDVGRFSNSLNEFIGTVKGTMQEYSNYVIENNITGESEDTRRIEVPEIKYSFYPDPSNETDWIFYLYDNKDRKVTVSNILRQLEAAGDTPTREDVIQILNELRIPFIQQGVDSSLIRSMNADTQGDDLIATHNIIQANANAFTQRDMDGSSQVPSGITREFANGVQLNPQDIIRQTTLIMPLRVTVDHYIVPRAVLFNPLYIFFPMKQFTGLYTIFEMGHEVQNGKASTKFTCMIEITRQNRAPC